MKVLSIAAAFTMAVLVSGCASLHSRTKVEGCLTNPCHIPAKCYPAPVPAPVKWSQVTVEK